MSARAACWSKGDTLVQFTVRLQWIPVVPTHLKSGCYCVLQVIRGLDWGSLENLTVFQAIWILCRVSLRNNTMFQSISGLQLHLLLLVHLFTWCVHLKNSRCFRWYVDFIYSYRCVHFKSSAPFFCPCFQMQLRYICMLQSKLLLASSRHSSKIATKPIVYRSLGWKLHV